jgi:hypothetical protein
MVRTTGRSAACAGLALLAAVAATADAAVLCRSKTGAVRVRDTTCRKRETTLDPAALGFAPAGHTHPELAPANHTHDDRYLGSERILSASVQTVLEPDGKVLFRDSATGLEVRATKLGRPLLVNTNDDGTPLLVSGLGYYTPASLHGYSTTLEQGESAHVWFEAVGFSYGTFMVVKRVADGTPSPRLQLTCAFRDSPIAEQVTMSCIGVR